MNKLNTYTIFGAMFLSSILLGNGMYSANQVFAQHENVTSLNEAEINADIEQENKCKKDTECENENKINNLLNITTITQTQQQQQQEQPEIPTCQTCFTDNMNEEELANFINEFSTFTDASTLDEVCEYIDEHQGEESLNVVLLASAVASISEEQYTALIQCLQDAGFNVEELES